MENTTRLSRWNEYCAKQNISFTGKRIFIDGLGAMAHGLFASLLIGCIISTLGLYVPGLRELSVNLWGSAGLTFPVGTGPATDLLFLSGKNAAYAVQGAAMGVAIALGMKAPPFVIYSCCAVGYAANALGGSGGPLAVFFVVLIAEFCGKLVSKRTPLDLIVTPFVTIMTGILAAYLIAPPIGSLANALGAVVMRTTQLRPFWMGILCSAMMGIILTLPISSAAICAALGLAGLAGGACVAGCSAHMIGFAVASYKENGVQGLLSQGLGTSMLQIPNLLRKPVLWLPPVIASVINGPIATCVFQLQMNGAPINAGMGTSGLCGQIGCIIGWLSPMVEESAELGINYAAVQGSMTMQWIGLFVCSFVIPVIVTVPVTALFRKKGWIRDGDYALNL